MTSFNLYKNVSETFNLSIAGYTETNLDEWDSGKAGGYSIDDMVVYNGSYYISVANTNSYNPTNTTYWKTLILRTGRIDNTITLASDYEHVVNSRYIYETVDPDDSPAPLEIALPTLTGVPATSTAGPSSVTFYTGSGDCYMYIGQPYSFVNSGVSFNIGTQYQDLSPWGGVYPSMMGGLRYEPYWCFKNWWPFNVTGIAQSTTIASAKITFKASANSEDNGADIIVYFGCELNGAVTTPADGNELHWRTFGSNYTTHSLPRWYAETEYTYDITTQVQTVINLASWTTNANLGLMTIGTAQSYKTSGYYNYFRTAYAYDTTAKKPYLTIALTT